MAKYLMIVESPNKVHTISSFLSKDYNVVATVGHVVDLPADELAVDIKNDFKPTFKTISGKEQIIKDIIFAAKKADMVYIATDPDVEGHGIGLNIYNLLPSGTKAKRVKYEEITKKIVLDAIANATKMEDDRYIYDAYETRRVLDRIAGYKTSWTVKQATGGPSAGRVQSAGLRILVELEKEIRAFIPEIYWPIEAELLSPSKEKIIAMIKTPKPLDIKTQEQANKIIDSFKKGPIKVSKFDKTNADANPQPPFTTSTLLQAASGFLGFGVDKTTQLAQSLFTKSAVTYIRTDSVTLSDDALKEIRAYISNNYKPNYAMSKSVFYANKGKNVQGSHECIRPTAIANTAPTGLTPDEQKLYDMIWKRSVACQMAPAKYLRTSAEFSCDKNILAANGSKELFDGFRKVWTYTDASDTYLPELSVGDKVDLLSIKTEKKETQPPSHYSEASFIKEIERRGIGRPSTYKTIVQTLQDRKYVDKKGKSLSATNLGINVVDFLIKSDICFVDITFTEKLENDLDDIANQKKTKLEVLTAFWDRLKNDLKNTKDVKNDMSKTTVKCPECLKNNVESYLVKRHSRFGEFLSCPLYKKDKSGCNYIVNLDKNGNIVEKKKQEIKESTFDCPNCGEKLIIRISKANKEYLACKNWKDKKCAGFYGMDAKKMEFKKKNWGKKKKGQENEEEC